MKAHKQFQPQVDDFTSMFDGFKGYLSFVTIGRYKVQTPARHLLLQGGMSEGEKRCGPLFCTKHGAGKYNKQLLLSIISSVFQLRAYRSVKTRTHALTHDNTHDRMVGSRHTQVRCGGNKQIQIVFTSLLNKAALSVRLISNMFRFGAFFFSFCPFIFRFSSVFFVLVVVVVFAPTSSFFFSTVGSQSQEHKKRKKEKNQINLKRRG